MNKTEHLTADDLILFMDGELDTTKTAMAELHLLNCGDCTKRLRSLKNGSNAYLQYRQQVLEPALSVPTTGWARLNQESSKEKRRRWRVGWGMGWGIACACAMAVAYLQIPGQPNAQEILTRAAAAAPQAAVSLEVITGKQRFFRPASLETANSEARFEPVRVLFVQANYSWRNPLSARSFADWRRRLPQKADSITSIREKGGRKFYRVQTRTTANSLHSASLTLQADNYHATKAQFEFAGQAPIEVLEQTEDTPNVLQQTRSIPPAVVKATETAATPEDELRVFAVLDAMGAVAEEPIEITLDAKRQAVMVTGMGIPAGRRKEIETAMAALPHTIVNFSGGSGIAYDTEPVGSQSDDAGAQSPVFRQNLQDRYGGARQFQTAADKALDASNGLFAEAHLLRSLAREFPPGVESRILQRSAASLTSLRQRHLSAIENAARKLKEELSPLLAASPPDVNEQVPKEATWQGGAEDLFGATRNLDRKLSRLLAGKYTEEEGNQMLQQLPSDLMQVETLARALVTIDHR